MGAGFTIVILLTLWLSNRALGPGQTYDSGLYHWNTILWENGYAIIPGLGNLHHRLAFNSASLLFDAMLNTGPWQHHAGHLANGLMTWMLWLIAAWGLVGVVMRRPTPSSLFAMLLALPAAQIALGSDLASPTTDTPLAIMTLLGAWSLVAALLEGEDAKPQAPGADRDIHLANGALFLTTAICLKLSGAFFFLAAAPIWLALVLGRGGEGQLRSRRAPIVTALFCVLLLVTLACRGAILSGYPFFPSTVVYVPTDWRMPQVAVDEIRRGITQFARNEGPHASTSFNQWNWTLNFYRSLYWPTTLYCLESAPILLLLAWLRLPVDRRFTCLRLLAFWVATVGALGAWFLAAPDIRYGWHLFWLMPLSALALLAKARQPTRVRLVAVLWSLPILTGAVVFFAGWREIAFNRFGPAAGFYPVPHASAVHDVVLGPNVVMHVANDQLIWDYPLPVPRRASSGRSSCATPWDISRGFRFRRPSDHASGR